MLILKHQERMRADGEHQAQHFNAQAESELRAGVWADVKAHQAKQREERRQSLAWRIAESRRQKEVDLGIHSEKMTNLLNEIKLRRQDWLDVKQYEHDEKIRRRMSVMLRLDSWRIQKMAEQKLKAKKMLIAQEEARCVEMDREALLLAERDEKERSKKEDASKAFAW